MYLWLKAGHLIAIVCWFAAMFYLPRLFVYHCMTNEHEGKERFKIMERKLFWGIMTPSAILTIVFGLWILTLDPRYYFSQSWMHIKLALVAFLIAYHGLSYYYLRCFANDCNEKSSRFFRIYNELPVFALIAIIILAVVKPVF